ncbi:hypothetical protein EJ08DRAFT_736495 [Tothia fuscella]|uniref:Uncharacterized protein n=1 Tax=Tothia fuscella TaxID=1048955 RepID=A0A9P4NLM3_9PEZI|nr:hypothetical protein EJ08DRAFT_736495 [Tothia fuscella]
MLQELSNFGNNAAALEKTLRLGQSLSQIAGGVAVSSKDAVTCNIARSQFALSRQDHIKLCQTGKADQTGRRFFRLHKWIDCWSSAHTHFYSENSSSVEKMLETFKWSFHGMYFFLEMLTISNVMGLTATSWGPKVTIESNKFWFYGLVTSIILSLYHLWLSSSLFDIPEKSSTTEEVEIKTGVKKSKMDIVDEKSAARPVARRPPTNTSQIWKQLIIDGCDLFIPGSVVGWIPADAVTVGVAMAVSSFLAGRDIWIKVNSTRTK